MNTIVIGYDDTPAAKRALERVAMLGRAFDSHLVVTSVAPVASSAAPRSLGTDPADTALEHRHELENAREYLGEQGLTAEYVEAVGHPADSIVAAADQHGADLIVVGTREPGFVERLLGTSVSDSVSHRAHCDVLIVH
ncbi:MAG TPA: universal stress protein [Solirubrobacteraceae bacterium]|jgi:nucleotide-binding universal stress UspA family protein|nr:universal stress protein [Solirubrobacteraceae bacterium]